MTRHRPGDARGKVIRSDTRPASSGERANAMDRGLRNCQLWAHLGSNQDLSREKGPRRSPPVATRRRIGLGGLAA
jgi:hypothetical protein